jgi:hypothetical protein
VFFSRVIVCERVGDREKKAKKAEGGGAIADVTTNAKSASGNDP